MSQYYTPLLLPPALVRGQQAFGFALLQQVAQAAPQTNVFLSPFSVATALLLALEGSAGATQEAIRTTLRVSEILPAKLLTAVARQLAVLTQQDSEQPALRVANGLWADQDFVFDPAFTARLQQQYQAQVATLDFTAPGAADSINAWVSQHTQGKITHLVDAANLMQQALVLVNAVYFKGSWTTAFKKAATRPGPFMLANGASQTAPLMQQRSNSIGYQRGDNWQAVQLSYAGSPRSASMQLFIPDQPTGLPDFLNSLTTENWAQWQAAFSTSREVDLTLPRFRLDWDDNLTTALEALGLGPALSPGADFTPMGFSPAMPGFISQITHKTYLSVDEKGTEAAAVTAIMWMGGSASPPPPPQRVVVRVDRPFFCAIVDDETGTILFNGAVYNPVS